MSEATSLFLFCMLGAVYFLPVIVAVFRNHTHFAPIFVVNLFAGWTLVGWVAALAWSVSTQVRSRGLIDRAIDKWDGVES